MSLLDGSAVLITGGTGSLGTSLIKTLLANTKVKRVAVYSRDELKQANLKIEFNNDERLRWFIGDEALSVDKAITFFTPESMHASTTL